MKFNENVEQMIKEIEDLRILLNEKIADLNLETKKVGSYFAGVREHMLVCPTGTDEQKYIADLEYGKTLVVATEATDHYLVKIGPANVYFLAERVPYDNDVNSVK